MFRFRHVILVAAGLLLSGCATILGDDNDTLISTEPAFVRCSLTGTDFDKVVNTPQVITLPKGSPSVRIACRAKGYRDAFHTLESAPDPLIFANLVFGSSLGMVVDMINGSAKKFPSQVTIHLEPKSFATSAMRDEWYRRYRRAVEVRWSAVVADLEVVCMDSSDTALECLDELKQAENSRGNQLRLLEQRRLAAGIREDNQARMRDY